MFFVHNAFTSSDWAGEISKLANLLVKKISGSTNFHAGIRVFSFVCVFDDGIMMGSTLVKRFFF